MEEKELKAVEDNAEVVDNETKPAENENGEKKFSGFLKKFKTFTQEKPELWQLIKFTLVSMTAGLTEIISFAILTASLRSVNAPFKWFIFDYTAGGGLGAFISFLVSVTLAQIVAFVVNRKKTFKANNNIVFSITAYAIMAVVFIIGLQVYTAPLMIEAFNKGINNGVVSEILVKALWMLFAFIITFFCSKYIIMREVKPKK